MSLDEAYDRRERRGRLTRLRGAPRERRLVIAGGVLIGLGLGSLHWLGLVLGGALVALPARSIPRGIGHGLGLGILGLVAFTGLLAANGALAPALTTGSVGLISAAIGLGAPLLGALVRALL